jgi:hypothetical protein
MKRSAILFIVLSLFALGAMAQSEENVSFKWAFGAVTAKEGVFVPITRDTMLHTGDDIKMLVELQKECFVYVVHAGPSDDITLLFPYSLDQFKTDYRLNRNYYIPVGRKWITFDKSTGKERFYLLASNERLTDLENLLTAYEKGDKMKKSEISKQIASEIRDVKRRFRTFATLAEKPVTIGGNIRGVGEEDVKASRPDVATIATQIGATNFYSKTITIDHR